MCGIPQHKKVESHARNMATRSQSIVEAEMVEYVIQCDLQPELRGARSRQRCWEGGGGLE